MKQTISKEELINVKFIVEALTKNLYNNKYVAICDIIDNSIEKKVNSSNVGVIIKKTKGINPKITSIIIYDNGSGMDQETLYKAIHFGCETGKEGLESLGLYGAGLKTSAMSMADNLNVITKTKDGGFVKGYLNIKKLSAGDADFAGTDDVNKQEIALFKEILGENADQGTIVIIDDFRKIGNTYHNFTKQLTNTMGEVFSRYISGDSMVQNRNINFYVQNTPVRPIFPETGCVKLTEKYFKVPGHKNSIKVTTYYVPADKEFGPEGIERGLNSAGVYIYRQGRLVGRGLNYGTSKGTKHSLGNCFRAIVEIDGTYDEVFGTNFTKVVNDRNLNEIPAELKEMVSFMNEARLECEEREKRMNKDKNADEADMLQNFNILKMAAIKMGSILEFATMPFGKERHNGGKHYNTNTNRTPAEKNPNPRERKGNCPFVFDFANDGKRDKFYRVEHEDNVLKIVINMDHPYYTYFNSLSEVAKQVEAMKIATFCYAKHNIGYFTDEDNGFIQNIIDGFEDYISKGYYGVFSKMEDKIKERKYDESEAV